MAIGGSLLRSNPMMGRQFVNSFNGFKSHGNNWCAKNLKFVLWAIRRYCFCFFLVIFYIIFVFVFGIVRQPQWLRAGFHQMPREFGIHTNAANCFYLGVYFNRKEKRQQWKQKQKKPIGAVKTVCAVHICGENPNWHKINYTNYIIQIHILPKDEHKTYFGIFR